MNRADLEGIYKAVIDYVLSRPDVDEKRLVLTGESYAGAKVMMHACYEDRFAGAVVPYGAAHYAYSRVLINVNDILLRSD